jgi:hypothetical protein
VFYAGKINFKARKDSFGNCAQRIGGGTTKPKTADNHRRKGPIFLVEMCVKVVYS